MRKSGFERKTERNTGLKRNGKTPAKINNPGWIVTDGLSG